MELRDAMIMRTQGIYAHKKIEPGKEAETKLIQIAQQQYPNAA